MLAVDGAGVHGEHVVAGIDQRPDRQTAIGLDPHYDPARVGTVRDHQVGGGDPLDAMGDASASQSAARLVTDMHVVVVLIRTKIICSL